MKPFPHLTGLSLDLVLTPLEQWKEPQDIVLYERCASDFRSLLDIYAQAPLAALSVPGDAATILCSTKKLHTLTHLALCNTRHLRNVDSVLEHCVRLESLWISQSHSLHNHDPSEVSALFQVLQAHPDALPCLTHLKITISSDYTQNMPMDILAAFVARKKHLRCLDWEDPLIETDELLPLLSVLPSLPALEVLGLYLRIGDDSMAEWLRSGALNVYIPERVTALRLSSNYEDHGPHSPDGCCWEELVSCINVASHAG